MKSTGAGQRQALLDALQQFPSGVHIDQIASRLKQPPTRRTLQRWLLQAIEQGQIRKEGRGRATRYHMVRTVDVEGGGKARARRC